jgi:lysylphosphatidylglycerol synthetase-like protein (DUF2156 family)
VSGERSATRCAGVGQWSDRRTGPSGAAIAGAPLARTNGAPQGSLDNGLDVLGAALEPMYGVRSLHSFMAKFQPRTEPVYLCFRVEADLPRIGIALTRAYLPSGRTVDRVRLARKGTHE